MARPGQRHRQIDGNRRFAYTALARAHAEHPGLDAPVAKGRACRPRGRAWRPSRSLPCALNDYRDRWRGGPARYDRFDGP